MAQGRVLKTYDGFFHDIPTMKTLGSGSDSHPERSEGSSEKDEVQEAVDKAKDAFEGAVNAGAAAAATIGAELASRVEEKLRKLGIDHVILSEGAEGSEAEGSFDFSKVKIEPLFEEEVDFDTFSKSYIPSKYYNAEGEVVETIFVPKQLDNLSRKLYNNRDKGEAKCLIK